MKKTVIFGLLVILLVFGFVGCGDGNDGSKWWTWMASENEVDFDSTARISITPNSDDSGCDVTVTGTVNTFWGDGTNWATQVGYNYTATVGKDYVVSWKWIAEASSFENVTIRYAQQKDYQDDGKYELGTDDNMLTIPTTEETKSFEFKMPENCFMNFTFMVGRDIGNFKIREFKIVEKP